MSQFDYCLNIWGNAPKTCMDKLLILQKRAARIVMNVDRYSPSAVLFKSLTWQTVYQRVKYISCVLLYKILNELSPAYLAFFEINTRRPGLRSAENNNLVICHPNSPILKRCFKYNAAHMWNGLPVDIKSATNLLEFKLKLKKYLLNEH